MGTAERLTKCLSKLDHINDMLHLQQIQAQMIKTALDQTKSAVDRLVAFSAVSDHGDLNYACSILNHVLNPTLFLWNTIIRGFSRSREPEKTFIWYSNMVNGDFLADKFTFPFLLKACSRLFDLRKGQQVHCQIIKFGPSADAHIDSSLLHLYTSCGELKLAKIIFDELGHKSVVYWNSMISGCVKSGSRFREALQYFHEMRLAHENADKFSLVSVASACGNIGALVLGRWVHCIVYKHGYCGVVPLGNALVDMYGKFGIMEDAFKVFDEMSVRDVVSWSAMIDVCATHGCGLRALDVLAEMERAAIVPDDMTFTSLLCACSHGGLLQQGKMWFDRMTSEYGVESKIQHFGCMVDLLGKAGQLKEAYRLIKEMPMEPDAAIWRSLVGACLFHGNLGLAELAAGHLLRSLDPIDSGDLVMISNVYARLGRWDDVERLRRGAASPGETSILMPPIRRQVMDIREPRGCSLARRVRILAEAWEEMEMDILETISETRFMSLGYCYEGSEHEGQKQGFRFEMAMPDVDSSVLRISMMKMR
ncbi:hypothetical protein NE237_005142 [Protea cynaroides]|uniref:Chlororespiratory reduction 4 n=1 Tax=Protea cynaroides TaxID=273540 RepID=A0A9Q0QU64_9MAGN|nr:hypothetical protein NE237_005142 [Protea cynaroides]